jgi:hypothetical protein
MTPKRLPVWMVVFFFAHLALSVLAVARGSDMLDLLGFPLVHIADPARLAHFLFANSALWALAFGGISVFRLRRRN